VSFVLRLSVFAFSKEISKVFTLSKSMWRVIGMKRFILLVALLLGIAVVVLLHWGFVPVKTAAYPIKVSSFQNWDAVFRSPGRFRLTPWQTGSVLVKDRTRFLDQKEAQKQALPMGAKALPVWAYYLQHPVWGEILIDTGFDQSFSTARHGNYNLAGRLYTHLIGVRHVQAAGQSLDQRLRQAQAHPQRVFLTHLHFDHTAGLPALAGKAAVAVGKAELDFVSRVTNGHYLSRLPRLDAIDIEAGQPMPPFAKAVDLLGDGSLWALKTPGHTPGHLSYLVMTVEGPVLITGDACFYYDALASGVGPFAQYPGDRDHARESLRQIRALLKAYPQVRVLVGHDDLQKNEFQSIPTR
jgi:glyoxylase-like metal-dependent hydrolase (beta-lactamase superfamily II)